MKTLLVVSLMVPGLAFALSCSDDDEEDTADAATVAPDGSAPTSDAGPDIDAASMQADASTADAGDVSDAGEVVDAGDEPDSGMSLDAAAPMTDAATGDAGASKTLLDLQDVSTNPDEYEWFDFRPNLLKLILSGAAETEHIAILWYTVTDGSVGLHYHAQTESVYAIDGTQTDAKGVYPTGTVYFNPPGSGHEISDSSGFFILAYASPPDFASTDLIEEYTPIRIDTAAEDFVESYPFEPGGEGTSVFEVPLDPAGGMSASFMEFSGEAEVYEYTGNYVLVLDGSCEVDGMTLGAGMLLVTKDVVPEVFTLTASDDDGCLTMGISF